MPTYEYSCSACSLAFEEFLPIRDCDVPQPCPSCKTLVTKHLSVPSINFPGDGWTSKNLRVDRQMREKGERRARVYEEKKREEPIAKLLPNFNGQQTESWREAQDFASKEGKDVTTYEPLISAERSASSR